MKTIQCIHLLKFNLIQLSNKLYFLSCFYIGLPFFHVQLWTDCSTPATTKKNLLKFTTVLQTIKGLNKIIPIEPNKEQLLIWALARNGLKTHCNKYKTWAYTQQKYEGSVYFVASSRSSPGIILPFWLYPAFATYNAVFVTQATSTWHQ